jgi:membrane protein YdbS with pleckstrin-like domain
MSDNYGSKFVRFDEAVFERIQPSFLHYRKQFAWGIALLLLSFFLLYPFLLIGATGFFLFLIVFGSAALVFARMLFMRSRTIAIVTNQRIIDIDRTGLFEKRVAEIELGHIQDIRYTAKGVLASVFGYGTVTVQAEVGRGRIELVNIPDPADVHSRLQQIQKQHTQTHARKRNGATQKEEK